jgi:hypothetical protein
MALPAFPIVALHNVESVFSLARRIGEDLTEIETDCCLCASIRRAGVLGGGGYAKAKSLSAV